jgi:hypothetical protein
MLSHRFHHTGCLAAIEVQALKLNRVVDKIELNSIGKTQKL